MSFGSYFRVALFLPLAFGLACIMLALGREPVVASPLMTFIGVATMSGGVPYFVYALMAYVWSTGRADPAIKTGLWLLPIGYLPFLFPPHCASAGPVAFAPPPLKETP